MEEMRVYIANLGKYVEGELVGAWFTVPVNPDEVRERIGLNDEYEEYAIHDYELPFEISEYTPIEEVNHLCEMVWELPEDIQDVFPELLRCFNSVKELCSHADDIIHYPGCEDMIAVAHYLIDECGVFGEIPDKLVYYVDYEAYARDLEIEGFFVSTRNGMFNCSH